ncbi:unnamed protein product [Effrenium voratum]|nr:unnamed protein product [Effrenium voratum]
MRVGSDVADNLKKVGAEAVVDIDMSHTRPVTEEERKRSSACCRCSEPATATNHVCPECHASLCFSCAREVAHDLRCPGCGDVERNAGPLKHYLAAGEAWEAARSLASRAGEGVLALSTGAGALTTRALSETSPLSEYDQSALRRAVSVQAQLRVAHACHLCETPSSAFDLACSRCSVSLCPSCVGSGLGADPCCPGCGDREVFNASAVRFQKGAAQISRSASQLWEGLWYLGQELFDAPAPAATGNPSGVGNRGSSRARSSARNMAQDDR